GRREHEGGVEGRHGVDEAVGGEVEHAHALAQAAGGRLAGRPALEHAGAGTEKDGEALGLLPAVGQAGAGVRARRAPRAAPRAGSGKATNRPAALRRALRSSTQAVMEAASWMDVRSTRKRRPPDPPSTRAAKGRRWSGPSGTTSRLGAPSRSGAAGAMRRS